RGPAGVACAALGRCRCRSAAAPRAGGNDRGAGAAVRLLLRRNGDQGRRIARRQPFAERRRDRWGNERALVPLRHLSAHRRRDPPRRRGNPRMGAGVPRRDLLQGGGARRGGDPPRRRGNARMSAGVSRRDLLKGGGALLVGFSLADAALAQPGPPQGPDRNRIDSWIAIHADNTATVLIGYVELGQGCTTALPQVAAEELDLGLDQLRTIAH